MSGVTLNNLPRPLTRFIGREREIAALTRLLAGRVAAVPRLVTLTGVGGCGKTRLALEAARALLDAPARSGPAFGDGVWFIALAPLSNPALVPQVVAAALDLPERPGLSLTETLVEALRSKQALLLLDNCEHLSQACAQLAASLLPACPGLTLLATSRGPLHLAGEAIFPVPPLEIINPNHQLPLTNLVQCESVRLFVDRATASWPQFALTGQNAPAVTLICQWLDGLPLAIELAAARIKMLTPQQIAGRLGDTFQLLRRTSPTTPVRHQNLQATFDWSYALLAEPERIVFRRLSVFAGGWTLGAAEQVLGDAQLPADQVLDLHERLLDQSLISRTDDGQGQRARYRLLEPVRQYSAEQLQGSGEAAACRRRHLDWCVDLAELAEPDMLRGGPDDWFARIRQELPNIRAALDWSLETQALGSGLRLAGALWPFWEMQSFLSEGRDWLERLLAQSGQPIPVSTRRPARVKALLAAGVLCWQQDRYEQARHWLEESIALAQETGADWYYAYGLCRLGRVMRLLGDPDQARRCFEQSLGLFRQLGDDWGLSRPLRDLGLLALHQGDLDQAQADLEQALAIRRAITDQDGIADALELLGTVCRLQGKYVQAANSYHEALRHYQAIGYRQGAAAILKHLGYLAQLQDQPARPGQFFKQSLVLSHEIGARRDAVEALIGLQSLAVAQGQLEHGARLDGLLETIAPSPDRLISDEYRALRQQALATVASVLDRQSLASLQVQGRSMSVAEALAGLPDPPSSTTPAGLTRREVEVLGLLVQGLTNRDIAERLVISPRTVHAHLRSIFGKLEVSTRTAAAREAARLKLV